MLTAVLSGCSAVPATAPDSNPASPTASSEKSSAPPMYSVSDLDICTAAGADDLGSLAHETEEAEPEENTAGDWGEQAKCVLRLRSADDEGVLLAVSATAHPSVAEATTAFADGRRDGGHKDMRDDGDVDDIGDEAYGKSRDRYHGLSQNLLLVRSANLVVYVFLSVQSEKTMPREELAEKTMAVARNILARAPRR